MGAGASATADPAALDVADVPLPEASEVARVVESVPADAQPAVGAALKRIGEIAKPAALAKALEAVEGVVGEGIDEAVPFLARTGGAIVDGVKSVDPAVGDVVGAVGDAFGEVEGYAEAALGAALDAVPPGAAAAVKDLVDQVGGHLPAKQMAKIAGNIASTAGEELGDNAVLCKIGGFCSNAASEVADKAPAVAEAIGGVLGGVAKHLPYIGVACGVLGAVYYAFKQSKKLDENVRNVMLWCTSLTDWLLMVADRVDAAGAESATQLFEEVQNGLQLLQQMCGDYSNKWRLTKMVTASSFQAKLEELKAKVKELKEALRDYLDAAWVEKEAEYLGRIDEVGAATYEAVTSQAAQLEEIKALIVGAQAGGEAKEEVDALWETIVDGSGACVGSEAAAIPTDDLLLAFEGIFLGGEDLTEAQSKGLAASVDRNDDGEISKGEWRKFYAKWQGSEQPMAAYLDEVAEANADVAPLARAGNGAFVSLGNGDRMEVQGTIMKIINAQSGDVVAVVANCVTPTFLGIFPWCPMQMTWTGEAWVEGGGCQWVPAS